MSGESLTRGTGRWIVCYWDENFEILDQLDSVEGADVTGVLMIAPPVSDLTVATGLWKELNSQLGTLFDVAEEERIESDHLLAVSAIVRRFADEVPVHSSRTLAVVSGQIVGPGGAKELAEMDSLSYKRWLSALAEFLEEAAVLGKSVTIAL